MSKKQMKKRNKKYVQKSVQRPNNIFVLKKSFDFWKPYVDLIGKENFFYNFSDNNMPSFVITKHYCGFDASEATGGEYVRDVAIRRAEYYKEVMSKDNLTKDDVSSLFVNSVCHQFYDEELLNILTKYAHCFSDEEHWEMITDYWVLQEMNTNGERLENWKKIFNLRPRINKLVEKLPETFTAYRAGDESGFSWSLSKETAEWFQNRFSDVYETEIHQREFKRDEILFYTNSRNEQEVVVA